MKNFCFSFLLLFALCLTSACGGDSTEVPAPEQNPSEQPGENPSENPDKNPDDPTPDNPDPDKPEENPGGNDHLDANGNIIIPDARFAAYMVKNFDTDGDGGISPAEAAAITRIECPGMKIESLEGIEYCTELTYLDCGSKFISYEGPYYNQLTSLDVSKNTKLTSLDCVSNKLTFLDVSKNAKLTELDCGSNSLTSIDVSKNMELTKLSYHGSSLTFLDVSKNTKLTHLRCTQCKQLTSLNVSKNTELSELNCSGSKLTSLDVSKNTKLTYLNCSSNKLTSLDVSKNTELIKLQCDLNQLTSLDVSRCVQLSTLYCQRNQLTSLDVSMTDLISNKSYPLFCAMSSLETLYLNKNWKGQIVNIDKNRNSGYISPNTTILYK